MRWLTPLWLVFCLACAADSVGDADPIVPTEDVTEADGAVEPDVEPEPEGCGAMQCTISGTCYDNFEASPHDPCHACVVAASTTQWSFVDGGECDDGSPCTLDDVCRGGDCDGTPKVCSDDNGCTTDLCDPDSGECVFTAAAGTLCDDGDHCTVGDHCLLGECTPGTDEPPCDDGDPCTVDGCDSVEGCRHAPESTEPCDDGDGCTENDACNAGVCAGEPTSCDDFDLCTVDACLSGSVCVYTHITDQCVDGNPCTDDGCDPETGCTYAFNTLECDDGDACTHTDTCNGGACLGDAVVPNDDNPCTDDSCDPSTGLVFTANTLPCDDGDPCWLGDTCADSDCTQGEIPLDCEDGNVCTDHLCASFVGCSQIPNATPCDDGSVCTQTDKCAETVCTGFDLLDCDDQNACTTDACHPVDGCVSTLIVSNLCRPNFLVDFPERGATVKGSASDPVLVTGNVSSGAGPITSMTLNGEPVEIGPGGAFAHAVSPVHGGNMLVFEAEDALGATRRRVQSYLWSGKYRKPTTPKEGMVEQGIGIWLSEAVFDDLSAALTPLVGSIDLADAVPSPAFENSTHKVYVNNLTHNAPTLDLWPVNGGLKLKVVIANLSADIDADGKVLLCVPNPWGPDQCTYYPSASGKFTASSVVVDADVQLSVDGQHQLKADITNVNVTINGEDLNLNGLLGELIDPIVDEIVSSVKGDLEDSFEDSVKDALGDALEEALQSLAFQSTFDMPSLDPAGGSVPIDLVTDFESVDFTSAGGAIVLRAGAYAPLVTPYDNLGVPMRMGCGNPPQLVVLLKEANLELALSDDFTNVLLYAAWRGGLLEFDVPPQMLAGQDLSQFGIEDLVMTVSGMLAPTMSDCASAEPQVHIGDMRIDANLSLLGTPMDVVVWVSLFADFEFSVDGGELGFGITDVETLEVEVVVVQDELVGSEDVIKQLIDENLVPGLLGSLGGGSLAGVPLPEIDLGGGASIKIVPDEVVRADGNTVVKGDIQ